MVLTKGPSKPRTDIKNNQPFVRQQYESPYLQPLTQRKQPKSKQRRKFRSASSNFNSEAVVRYPDPGGSGDHNPEVFQIKFDDTLHQIYKLIEENKGRLPVSNSWEDQLAFNLKQRASNFKSTMDPEEKKKEEEEGEAPPPAEEAEAPGDEPAAAEGGEEGGAEEGEGGEGAEGEGGAAAEAGPGEVAIDSQVMADLREADAKSKKTAEVIEAMREELAALAKKEKLTDEDAKLIQQKQAELLEKLSEFEQITTQVQKIVDLADITTTTMVEQKIAQKRQQQQGIPEESLPKVIICGGAGIDPVPKIIVCEPTNRAGCGQPLYQQLSGRSKKNVTQQPESSCKKQMDTSVCPPQPTTMDQASGGMPNYGGDMMNPWAGPSSGYPQVFPVGPMGAWPPPTAALDISSSSSSISNAQCTDTANRTVIRILTPRECSPERSASTAATSSSNSSTSSTPPCSSQSRDVAKDNSKKKKESAPPPGGGGYRDSDPCAALKKKEEAQSVKDDKGKVVELCKNEIKAKQVCKADIYKQMGLEIPKNYIQGDCCKAYQDAMGVNYFASGNQFSSGPAAVQKSGNICKAQVQNAVNESKNPVMAGDGKMCKQKFAQRMNLEAPGKCKQDRPKDMENVVHQMEEEVRAIQKELEMVQAERRGLELQKKLLTCTAAAPTKDQKKTTTEAGMGGIQVSLPGVHGGGGIAPVPINLQGGGGSQPACQNSGNQCEQQQTLGPQGPCKRQTNHMVSTCSNPALKVMGPPLPPPQPSPPCVVALEAQLSSLKEQYKKLQCDYNCKVEEVSIARCELESAKRESLSQLEKCQEAETRVDDLLERLRAVESEKSKMSGSKDQTMEIEQQLTLSKQRYRESQEELEECRTNLQETVAALEDYRNKYLTAQQTVEEQRRQLDIMEIENNRISEHINMEIKRVKSQFQEKLEELTPLPEMLKLSHQKLYECQQMRALSERSVEQLNKEVADLKTEKGKLAKQLDDMKRGYTATDAEKSNLQSSLNTGEKKLDELKAENVKLRNTVARLEELALAKDRRLDEKSHEVLQLSSQLETLREESARQVSRTKDRCESVRRTLQTQISDLERQLAQSRAAARTAQLDRDEIRAKMQTQIQCLNENFNQAQLRIRSLQTNVNYLKNSYTNIFAPDRSPVGPLPLDICGQVP